MRQRSHHGRSTNRYCIVQVRLWDDEWFRALSPQPPSAQTLWLRLLCGPETLRVPGVIKGGRAAMAEALRWPQDSFDACWSEIEKDGKAVADWSSRLIYLTGAFQQEPNRCGSPSMAVTWRQELADLPRCSLRDRIVRELRQSIAESAPGCLRAFDTGTIIAERRGKVKESRGLPAPRTAPISAREAAPLVEGLISGPIGGPPAPAPAPAPFPAPIQSPENELRHELAPVSPSKDHAPQPASEPQDAAGGTTNAAPAAGAPDGADAQPAANPVALGAEPARHTGAEPLALEPPAPRVRRAKPANPMPPGCVTREQAEDLIANASKGRYIAGGRQTGGTMKLDQARRAHPDGAIFTRVGEWLAAGGDAWKGTLDGRALATVDAWVAQAQAWDGSPVQIRGGRADNQGPSRAMNPDSANDLQKEWDGEND